jgi:hypothetical protein
VSTQYIVECGDQRLETDDPEEAMGWAQTQAYEQLTADGYPAPAHIYFLKTIVKYSGP